VVTSNANKAREVAEYFAGLLEVEHVALACPEFRHVDVGEIARGKAAYAYETLSRPLIVDDTGFFIDALGGFPRRVRRLRPGYHRECGDPETPWRV